MRWLWWMMGLAVVLLGVPGIRPALATGVTVERISALMWHDGRQNRFVIQMVVTGTASASLDLTLPAGATLELLEPAMTLEPLEAVTAPIDDVRQELVWDRRPLTPMPLMVPQPPNAATRLTVESAATVTTGRLQFVRDGRSAPLGIALPGDSAAALRWLEAQFADAALDLFLALDVPTTIRGASPVFVGPLAGLPESPVLTKLPGSPLVVRHHLTAAAPLTATALTDLTPVRSRVQRTVQIDGWRRMALPIIGVAAVMVASVMAFSLSLVIRRRIDALGERR